MCRVLPASPPPGLEQVPVGRQLAAYFLTGRMQPAALRFSSPVHPPRGCYQPVPPPALYPRPCALSRCPAAAWAAPEQDGASGSVFNEQRVPRPRQGKQGPAASGAGPGVPQPLGSVLQRWHGDGTRCPLSPHRSGAGAVAAHRGAGSAGCLRCAGDGSSPGDSLVVPTALWGFGTLWGRCQGWGMSPCLTLSPASLCPQHPCPPRARSLESGVVELLEPVRLGRCS